MQILKNYKARLAAAALGILCAAAAPLAAHAQDFPTQPVKIVVPFPAGGTTDILARQMAKELGERWGKPVIVDNKAGASGTIFSEQLARMPADGHTLMLTATHHVINPGLYKNLKYDTRTDFTPIAQIAAVPNVLVVHPGLPAKNVQELITYAKANPGRLSFASSGSGASSHLAGVLFNMRAGTDIQHVPYKGTGPALNDLLGGQVSMAFTDVLTALPHVKSGRLRLLGVTSAKRSQATPDTPTLEEQGLKDFDVSVFFGIVAPAATPPAVVSKLNAAFAQALQQPDVKANLAAQGLEPPPHTSPAQLADTMRSETAKWREVIKVSGATVD